MIAFHPLLPGQLNGAGPGISHLFLGLPGQLVQIDSADVAGNLPGPALTAP
jgi:hypothetical protein